MGIYLVMKNNLKRSLRHKLLFLITSLLPIMVCCLFGLIRFDQVSLRIGILEGQGGTAYFAQREELEQLLDQSEGITYAVAGEASSNTDLMMGRFHFLLDYRDAASMGEGRIISYQSEERKELLRSAWVTMLRTKRPLNLSGYHTTGLSTTERSIAMLFTLFLVFTTIHASAIIHDRNNGVLLRYQFSGYRKSEYMAGYFLYGFLLSLIQVLLCIMVLLLLQPGFTLKLTEIVILAPVIAILSEGFGTVICSTSRSEVSSNIVASSLAGIFSILGGTFVAVAAMPWLLRILSFASPVRWIVELLQRI